MLPLSLLAALCVAVLTLVAGVTLTEVTGWALAIVAGVAGGVTLPLSLGMQWYLLRTRIEGPLLQLEAELLGLAFPGARPDVLTGSLRDCLGQVRDDAVQAVKQAKVEQEKGRDCRQRLDEHEAADALRTEAAELLPAASSPGDFATAACRLATRVWPVGDVFFLERRPEEKSLVALAGCRGGVPLEREELATMMSQHPYAVASLPTSLKTALLCGECIALGLPFSDDLRAPAARSFAALGLEHRGAINGLLYLTSPESEPPSPAALTGLRSCLSLAYSRAQFMAAAIDAANRDVLTGALTEYAFQRALEKEILRGNRYGRAVACALLDLDNLRRVNETHGSHAGDAIIAETARVIQEQVRASDRLARLSGGTFALILPETSVKVASVAVERIRKRVQEHAYLVRQRQVERMTLCAGLAVHPPLGATALALCDAAHGALLEAKRVGGNHVLAAKGDAVAGRRDG